MAMNENRESNQNHNEEDDNEGMTVIQSMDEIPQFTNEDEEDAFWQTHTLASHLWIRRGLRPGSLAAKIASKRRTAESTREQP